MNNFLAQEGGSFEPKTGQCSLRRFLKNPQGNPNSHPNDVKRTRRQLKSIDLPGSCTWNILDVDKDGHIKVPLGAGLGVIHMEIGYSHDIFIIVIFHSSYPSCRSQSTKKWYEKWQWGGTISRFVFVCFSAFGDKCVARTTRSVSKLLSETANDCKDREWTLPDGTSTRWW